MGGILSPAKEEEIKKLLRLDDSKNLQEFLTDNQLTPDNLYTKHKRTLIQLSCYYESPKCLSKLIEMNYDYNQPEISNGNTPLFISCKFNCLSNVKILLSKDDCKKLVKNSENLNEFDIAFLKGNYQICYYLLYEYKDKSSINNDINNLDNDSQEENINTNMNINSKKEYNNYDYDINQIYQNYFYNNNFDIDNFLQLQESNKYPLFNMQLFFKSLCQKIAPKDCESFAPERKKTKDLMTKIPDPNETWGHFFKRIVNMELYNPPLIDKRNVSQMNSIYMNTQMKLMENEYGVKLNYYKPNIDENEDNQEEEDSPIIFKRKKNKKNINENNNIENEPENEDEKVEEKNNIENEGKKESICALKIKEKSSDRSITDINKNDE